MRGTEQELLRLIGQIQDVVRPLGEVLADPPGTGLDVFCLISNSPSATSWSIGHCRCQSTGKGVANKLALSTKGMAIHGAAVDFAMDFELNIILMRLRGRLSWSHTHTSRES